MAFTRIPLLSLILISADCFSQNLSHTDVRDITKITLFDPGISYEKRIGKLQSLYGQAVLRSTIYIGYSSALGNTSGIYFHPALGLQYRYYYNGEKRKAKGKRTEMNSLNYVSTVVEAAFYRETISATAEKDLRALKTFAAAWGFQRNFPKRFSLDLSFGLGYVYTKQTTVNDTGLYGTKNFGEFTYVGHIGIGFWLNKRN